MRENIQKLLDSDLSSNKIATLSGVDQSTIHRIRKGERSLDNITLVKAEQLYKLYKEMEKMELFNKVKEELSYRQKDNENLIEGEKYLKIFINNKYNVAIKENSEQIEMYVHDKVKDTLVDTLYKGESVEEALFEMEKFELALRADEIKRIKEEFSKYYKEVEENIFKVNDEYYIEIPDLNSHARQVYFKRKDKEEDEELFFMMMYDINVDNYVNRSIKRYL